MEEVEAVEAGDSGVVMPCRKGVEGAAEEEEVALGVARWRRCLLTPEEVFLDEEAEPARPRLERTECWRRATLSQLTPACVRRL